MTENYTQGFIDKCAEAGVDPEQLVKSSVNWAKVLGIGLPALAGTLAGGKYLYDNAITPMNAGLNYDESELGEGGLRAKDDHPNWYGTGKFLRETASGASEATKSKYGKDFLKKDKSTLLHKTPPPVNRSDY